MLTYRLCRAFRADLSSPLISSQTWFLLMKYHKTITLLSGFERGSAVHCPALNDYWTFCTFFVAYRTAGCPHRGNCLITWATRGRVVKIGNSTFQQRQDRNTLMIHCRIYKPALYHELYVINAIQQRHAMTLKFHPLHKTWNLAKCG